MSDRENPRVSEFLAKTPGMQYLVVDSQATLYEFHGG